MRRVLVPMTCGLSVVAAVLLRAQGPPPPPAGSDQAPPPAFRAATTLVPLDVRVVDKKGRPVTDLQQRDFTVTEDRVPQAVQIFHVQALEAEAPPAPGQDRVPRKTGPTTALEPSRYRVFLIFLGRGDLTGPSDGLAGATHLVKDRLLPQDRVAVMAWNRATDFTTDHTAILATIERVRKSYRTIDRALHDYFSSPAYFYGNRLVPATIQTRIDAVFSDQGRGAMRTINAAPLSEQTERQLREKYDLFNAPASDVMSQVQLGAMGVTSLAEFFSDTAQTMQDQQNLYAGIEFLKHLDGEKHLVWVTEYGLLRNFRSAVEDDRDIGRAAADARVVLDVIRTGGTAMPPGGGVGTAESRRPQPFAPTVALRTMLPAQSSRILADLTGGRSDANRFTNASAAADVIESASRTQYLLGYYPTNTRLDGRFRNVVVTVDRPDVTVLVRRGYYARREAGPLDRRAIVTFGRVSTAAANPVEIPDIPLRAEARTTDTTVTLTVHVDVSRVLFQPVNGRQVATLQVGAFCLSSGQKPVGDVQRGVELSFTDARLAAVRTSGVDVPLTIPVSAAPASIKLVVYDYGSDLTGSRNVTVPPAEAR